jgi:hypothetical protein
MTDPELEGICSEVPSARVYTYVCIIPHEILFALIEYNIVNTLKTNKSERILYAMLPDFRRNIVFQKVPIFLLVTATCR